MRSYIYRIVVVSEWYTAHGEVEIELKVNYNNDDFVPLKRSEIIYKWQYYDNRKLQVLGCVLSRLESRPLRGSWGYIIIYALLLPLRPPRPGSYIAAVGFPDHTIIPLLCGLRSSWLVPGWCARATTTMYVISCPCVLMLCGRCGIRTHNSRVTYLMVCNVYGIRIKK